MSTKSVSFPRFPTWNYHFPERDVAAITAVTYLDPEGHEQSLPLERVRLTCGRSGVSGVFFIDQHTLPATQAGDVHAVTIEYEV